MISTHAPLAGRDNSRACESLWEKISTHAPLAGRDHHSTSCILLITFHFNPRAPCGARQNLAVGAWRPTVDFNPRAPCGARQSKPYFEVKKKQFQPTRPLRGATKLNVAGFNISHISTHAPLAGRDSPFVDPAQNITISTHAPLAGRDSIRTVCSCRVTRFQPTRPLRGATMPVDVTPSRSSFQPTRPLRGATRTAAARVASLSDFNPRAPCGARPRRRKHTLLNFYFNPRAPCGARPDRTFNVAHFAGISTHAPLAGRDSLQRRSVTPI